MSTTLTDREILTEEMKSLAEARQMLPRGRNGSLPHFSTLVRWITDGAKARDGSTVKLDAIRLGGRWITSKEALIRFMDRLTVDPAHGREADSPATSTRPRTSVQAKRDLKRAEAACREKRL
jgi:hypothetical protein